MILTFFSGCECVADTWSYETFPNDIPDAHCETLWLSWSSLPIPCTKTYAGMSLSGELFLRKYKYSGDPL